MVLETFDAQAKIVEFDATRILSPSEIDVYSVVDHLKSRLAAMNWELEVIPVMDGWPDSDDLAVPGVYVDIPEVDVAGVELGSNGNRSLCIVTIFGSNDAQRRRLAELIKALFRDTIPIFSYTTGNETSPTPTGEYFITDSVGWRKLPSPYNASDNQQWRSIVTANLRRVE
jgi:hypothetical protein